MPKKLYKCETCNKEFYDWKSSREKGGTKHFFCSRPCKHEWNKTVVGFWKGKSMSEKARRNMSKNHADFSGSKNGRWKGGKRIDKDGYVLILKKNHPHADYHGYIREHRMIMENKLNRILKPEEVVHHINHNKADNRIENLMLLKNCSEHMSIHAQERKDAKSS